MSLRLPARDVISVIHDRRSVRSFRDRPVPRATIEKLLDAAVCAPTAMHDEPWEFAVLQDRGHLRLVSDRARELFRQRAAEDPAPERAAMLDRLALPDYDLFHHAGTLIVIGSSRPGAYVLADCWLAAENLMLAACALELGTCVVGSSLPALNEPAIKERIGLPARFMAIAPIVVGYPLGEPEPASRERPTVVTWA